MSSFDLTISLNQLNKGLQATGISIENSSSDKECDVDLRDFQFTLDGSFINGNIYLPICLESDDAFIGTYDILFNCETIEPSGETYTVSGMTGSCLDEFRLYNGTFQVGLNFSKYPYFSGVLENSDEQTIYVKNGIWEDGAYLEGTGIRYIDRDNVTFFSYERDFFTKELSICDEFKDDMTWGETYPQKIENNVIIDRGNVVSVFEKFYRMMEIKTVDGFEDENVFKQF